MPHRWTEVGTSRTNEGQFAITEAHASISEPPQSSSDYVLAPAQIRPLHEAMEAFAARVALIRAARKTIDAQYYIWHRDLSGALIFEELEAAADRGISVRLLLDDNGVPGLDPRLAALDSHPLITVRLFNPFPIRRPRALSWLVAFRQLNFRMHAKSLTADDRATILGGRNIGDEYFDAKPDGLFDDLDVLAAGPVISGVRAQFDRHWRDPRTRPVGEVLSRISSKAISNACAQDTACVNGTEAARYREAVRAQPLAAELRDGDVDLLRAPAAVIATGPFAAGDPLPQQTGIAGLLPNGLGTVERELILVSGYFVPTSAGCEDLSELVRSGVRVRVLTNSFAATDVGIVHAGYAPCRPKLLGAGVELFEMPSPDDAPKTARKFIKPGSNSARAHSGRSLHAKIYIADRQRVYIGSANFDPRSAHLNSELGLVIKSHRLAERMTTAFERATQRSYQVSLGQDGKLRWTDLRDDHPLLEATEPGMGPVSRALVALLSHLGLENLL